MTTSSSPALELPAMLFGLSGVVDRQVDAASKVWTREFVQTGSFTQPRRMRAVEPDELLVMDSGAEPDIIPRARWRLYLFTRASLGLDEDLAPEQRQRMKEAFESFCLNTPWGALCEAARPSLPRNAEHMARGFAAVLRFWETCRGPRYAVNPLGIHSSFEDLMDSLHRTTLEAWCPGGPASVREHLSLTVERIARATRRDCEEAVLRAIPLVTETDTGLKHRELLRDPDFLRERLAALSPQEFESVSSASPYVVAARVNAWDRELARS